MSFTSMEQGTKEDWDVIITETRALIALMPDKIMEMLRSLAEITTGFACDQLHHSLMTATLAERDGASDEEIIISLCHDIGKTVSVPNHGPIAAEILRAYISEDAYQVLRHHQQFQGAHYYQFLGAPTDLREQWRETSWFPLAEKLVDRWDAPAFDPDYPVKTLEAFEPLIRSFFAEPKQVI